MATKAIWKYTFETPVQTFDMPIGARVLHLDVQFDAICMWALVDIDAEVEERTFRIYGTGDTSITAAIDNLEYIGTVQRAGGRLIWHVFEVVIANAETGEG